MRMKLFIFDTWHTFFKIIYLVKKFLQAFKKNIFDKINGNIYYFVDKLNVLCTIVLVKICQISLYLL